jgi:hypothetical protein
MEHSEEYRRFRRNPTTNKAKFNIASPDINTFLVNNPALQTVFSSVPPASAMSAMSAFATPLLSNDMASNTVYLSAIQPLLTDDTQTITVTASTIVMEGNEVFFTSLNTVTLSADTEFTITTPLVSLSQDLQVASTLTVTTIQASQIQVDQLSVSNLSLPAATLSTFTDPATSSFLIQINGSWWKIPIVPA